MKWLHNLWNVILILLQLKETENNGNTKSETLKGGDINVTTTRVTTASARAAGTIELQFTRQENTGNLPMQIHRDFFKRKKKKISLESFLYFYYFCSKHRLWVHRCDSNEYQQSMPVLDQK